MHFIIVDKWVYVLLYCTTDVFVYTADVLFHIYAERERDRETERRERTVRVGCNSPRL